MTIQQYATTLLAHMGIQGAEVSTEDIEDGVQVLIQVSEEDSGMMIGRRGETIEALQRIVSLTFRDELGEKRLHVRVNDYMDRRQELINRIVQEAMDHITSTGRPATLPYLSSEERRYVHTVMKDKGVETMSNGMGRDRRLTVYPVGYLQHEDATSAENSAHTEEVKETE